MKAFNQESQTYNFLIPKLQRLRSELGLKPLAFAECYFASAEKELILMENLKAKGFQVVEKKPERELPNNNCDIAGLKGKGQISITYLGN